MIMNEDVFKEIETLLRNINLEDDDKNKIRLFLSNKKKLVEKIREFEKKQIENIHTIEDLKKILDENDTFLSLKRRIFSLFEQYIFLKLEDVKHKLEVLEHQDKKLLLNEIIEFNSQLEKVLKISESDFQKVLYAYLKDKEGSEGRFLELIKSKGEEKKNSYSKLYKGILFLRFVNIFKKKGESDEKSHISTKNLKNFLTLLSKIRSVESINIPNLNYETVKVIRRVTEHYLKNKKEELLSYNTSVGQIKFVEGVIFEKLNITDIHMGSFYSCLSKEFKDTMTKWNKMDMPYRYAKYINSLSPNDYKSYNTSDGQIKFVEDVIFEELNITDINMGHFHSCLNKEFKNTMTNWNMMQMPYKNAKYINSLNPNDYKSYNTSDGQIRFIEGVIFVKLKITDIHMGSFYSCLSKEFKNTMTNWNIMQMPYKNAKYINSLSPNDYKSYNTSDGQIKFVEDVIFEKLNITDIHMGHFHSCLSKEFKDIMTNWNMMQMPYKNAKYINSLNPNDYKSYNTSDGQIRFVKDVIFEKLNITDIHMGHFHSCLSKEFKNTMTNWNIMQMPYKNAKYINSLNPNDYESYNTSDGQIRFVEDVIFVKLKITDIHMGSFYSCLSKEFKNTMTNWNMMQMPYKNAKYINSLNPNDYESYNTSDGQIRFVKDVIFEKLNITDIHMGSFYSCLSKEFKNTMTNWNVMQMPYKNAKYINSLNPNDYESYNTSDGQIRFVKDVIFEKLNITDIHMGSFYSCLSKEFKNTMTNWNIMQMPYKNAKYINSLNPNDYESYNTSDGQIRFVEDVIFVKLNITDINMRSFYSCLSKEFKEAMTQWCCFEEPFRELAFRIKRTF